MGGNSPPCGRVSAGLAVVSDVVRIRIVSKGVALGAIVLLMTGCIKLDMDLKISSDNKVSGTVIFAFNKQLLSLTGQSPTQVIEGSGESIPGSGAPGTSVSPYEDDQFSGEKVTYEDVDLGLINQGSTADSLKIERVGDEFHISGTLDFGNTDAQGNPLGDAAQQTLSSAQLSVKLTFPGAVTASNGQVEGNSVTWTPKIGEKMPLTAVASAIGTGSSFPTWALAAIGVVLLVVVVAIMMIRRRPR
jgi:hypothetical protein